MKLPMIKLVFTHPPFWLVLIYIMCIIYLFDAIQQKNQKQLSKASILFSVVLLMHYFSPYFNPFGKVMFIDVGQGDSIFIKLPFHRGNYLIDTGGKMILKDEEWKKRKNSFSTGKDIVIPILKGEGISKLDKLIFSHGDFDHIGGGIDLLKSFQVKTLCVGDKVQYKPVEKDMIQFAKKKGITISKLHKGSSWKNKSGEFHVLSPKSHYQGEENHGSIVIYALVGGHSWLFTGDFEQLGEEQLIQRYPNLTIDYLKVGHHGSETSSSLEFLKKIKPQVGIISVGKKNRYGHPKPVILNRFDSLRVPILRTDQNGAIIFHFFGRQGTFYTFKTYRKT
jgi:competence protein ComEC